MKKFVFLVVLMFSTAAVYSEEAPTESPETDASLGAVAAQLLLQSLAENIERNIEGAKIESGELAKLVRALSGVSIKDIEKHGICGGKNSELRKLLGSDACGKI
ncbi:hypothetical protein [Paraglaciecola chathamensis]|uniref:Secreted protein n=1 Tax=Paraglaciecola chathamensis TaxID=368405 RepID=A0A8H9IDH3_9ALTE|nr:hypothetical protein [Paraglaciecola oceanifecundans]GGZ75652.1 hypothetical protein GCM10011274_37470 [Paraglaciecola oceanifecundans]